MTARPNPFAVYGELIKPMMDFGNSVQAGLEPGLVFLTRIRTSQINGCAISLYNNTRLARENGESEERIAMLDAWRSSSLYSDRERAALAWAEALTLVSQSGAPEEDYTALSAHFSDEEQVRLTLLISVVNAFNRLGVGFRVNHPPVADRKAA